MAYSTLDLQLNTGLQVLLINGFMDLWISKENHLRYEEGEAKEGWKWVIRELSLVWAAGVLTQAVKAKGTAKDAVQFWCFLAPNFHIVMLEGGQSFDW